MTEELIAQARQDYGDVITKVVAWPPGLGIDVHLIGGDVVQYHPSGRRYAIDQPSAKTKALRGVASLVGRVRRLLGRQ